MKIVQVVPRIAASSSGPSVSVPSMCGALAAAGHDVNLMVLQPAPSPLRFEPTTAFPCLPTPLCRRLGVSPAMDKALRHAAREADILHTNSLWMMPNIYPARAVRGTSCRSIISPRGTLSPWARRRARFRKQLVWIAGQGRTLRAADCIHVTSQDELKDVRDQGLRNPVAIVPNGVCCPNRVEHNATECMRTLLFLARIHPTKGIDTLLDAWQVVSRDFPEWRLNIAGPLNTPYARAMQQKARTLSLRRVEFLGEVTGRKKAVTFAEADLYVLPTHSENFGISIAEALAHAVPAIVSHGAPWEGLNSERAGWWIAPGVDSLIANLRTAMAESPEQLRQRGEAGRRWMQRDFSWTTIGAKMEQVYRWLRGDRPRPDHVDVLN